MVSPAIGAPPANPATVADIGKVLNLATLPLAEGAEPPRRRTVASLRYTAPGSVTKLFAAQRKQLLDRKWTEASGGMVSEQYASGVFTRDGYTVSLTVTPVGTDGRAAVSYTHHGNVDLTKLPLPPGAKPMFAGPTTAMFLSPATVEQTGEALKKLLLEQGWQPYGDAGGSMFFKQNAVRLQAFVVTAPAQGGKTMITYSSELMSADLPAPPSAIGARYTDQNTQLMFDTESSLADVVDYYRKTLGKTGWEPTLKNPVKIEFKDTLLFLSPQKDLITLESYDFEGKTRVLLTYTTAAEVQELNERVKAAAEKQKLARSQTPSLPKLAIAIPASANEVELAKSRIEFKIASDKLKPLIDGWRKQLAQDGWEERLAVVEDKAGSIVFKKAGQEASLTYVDTGFFPAEVTWASSSVELERASDKK